MSISCGCVDMWFVFLTLILLTRFSQRGCLVSGGGQWAVHVPRGFSRLISISKRWGWARYLPGRWSDGGPWSTSGKWAQCHAALMHAPIPELTWNKLPHSLKSQSSLQVFKSAVHNHLISSGQVRNGSMRRSRASLRPLSTASTPGASARPSPRQMTGPSLSP